MIMHCLECTHGTKTAMIYARPDEIRVLFRDDSCECVLGQIDQVRMAAAALRQQAVDMERNVAPASAELAHDRKVYQRPTNGGEPRDAA